MTISSYLVIPTEGATDTLAERLADLPGCEIARAENRDVLLLVTDTPSVEVETVLRRRLEGMEGVGALILTFGEIAPADFP